MNYRILYMLMLKKVLTSVKEIFSLPSFQVFAPKPSSKKMYNTWKIYENVFSHTVHWVPKYSVTNVTTATNVPNCHYYRMFRISSSHFPTVKLSSKFIPTFIHLLVCLTTGPKPLPKRALHIVRSRASSFK